MTLIQCKGEGQGSCTLCDKKGKWNRVWMCLLYKIEGYNGIYCYKCCKEIEQNPSILEQYNID